MASLIPAIIPKSLEDLSEHVTKLPFAPWIQIDVLDGVFVPFTSWPYDPPGTVASVSSILVNHDIEVDLMVAEPHKAAEEWIAIGAKRIVVHVEGVNTMEVFFGMKEQMTFELGVSLNNDTELEVLLPHISRIDFVQLMGIADIGSQGQPFDELVLERARILKEMHPELLLSVDGSVNKETIMLLKEAGIDRFICGSAILNAANPQKAYEELKARI